MSGREAERQEHLVAVEMKKLAFVMPSSKNVSKKIRVMQLYTWIREN